MDCRHQGWAIKDFSVLSEMGSICGQPLYDIILMILHTNTSCVLIIDQNLQIFLISILKNPNASGHSRGLFTSCPTCKSWHDGFPLSPHVLNGYGSNAFGPNEYYIWHAWPSTCWYVENELLRYEALIFTAQTRNHWQKWKGRASVPKNGLPNWCDWILYQRK